MGIIPVNTECRGQAVVVLPAQRKSGLESRGLSLPFVDLGTLLRSIGGARWR